MGQLNITCDEVIWHNGAGDYTVVTTPTGPIGPLTVNGSIPAVEGGTYTVTWYGPGANNGPIVVWGSQTATAPTDCDHPQETTTTVAETTTTSVASTTTTAVADASTTTTSAGPPTSPVPSSTTAPAIDLDVTVCTETPESCLGTTIAVPVDSTLPATGIDSGDAAGIAFGLLVAGVLAVWAARRRTTPVVGEPKSHVTRVRPAAGPFDWTTEK